MKAENTLVHPQNLIIAARAKVPAGNSCYIQVLDMKNEKKVSQAEIKEDIDYWTWLNNTTLGVVGKSSVYHVDAKSGSVSKMFDRASQLADSHIMGYSMSGSGNWVILHGIKSGEDTASAPIVICDPSYTTEDKLIPKGQVIRAICLLNHPIPDTNNAASVQVIIPAK
jgi:RAB protein geranylgeranyltransferase component A